MSFICFELISVHDGEHGHSWASLAQSPSRVLGTQYILLGSLQTRVSLGNRSRCIRRKILQEKLAAEDLANVKVKSAQMFHVYVCTE